MSARAEQLQSTTWTRGGLSRSTTWTRRVTATLAAGLTGLVAFSPGTAFASTPSGSTASYVVRAQPGQLVSLDKELRRSGTVTRQIRLIEADVATLTASEVARLRTDARVASITRDARVRLASAGSAAGKAVDTLSDVADEISASAAQDEGITGSGVDVALIDSGIASVPGLRRGKVVHGPDLSFDSQDADLAHTDGFGHGTHLAGIIAGRSATLKGLAPDARLVDVKVADAHGNADVSQVIAGIDWVVQHAHADGLRIRVLNLSFGTDSQQSYRLDPLAYAAEQAWHAGIVVVVSAGNRGSGSDRLTDPAIDPYVLAVGAADTTGDDVEVAGFSSRGNGIRNPDVLAPGAHVASAKVPGSVVDEEFGRVARAAAGQIKGSGTSQAAAVVSGAAALLLDARPGLSPDQVKGLLMGTADPIPGARARAQGSGLIDVAAALKAPATTETQGFVRAIGTGSLEGARGSGHVRVGSETLRGEQDIFGNPVDTAALAALEADHAAWAGGTFNGATWTANGWGSQAWGSQAWGSQAWASTSWASTSWASTSWASTSWASTSWASTSWASTSWS